MNHTENNDYPNDLQCLTINYVLLRLKQKAKAQDREKWCRKTIPDDDKGGGDV